MSAEEVAPPAQSEIWEAAAVAPPESGSTGAAPERKLRCKPIDREQMTWAAIDVDQLVPPDHFVRALWALVGKMDLSLFWANSKAVEGMAGCSPYDSRLLICLWVLAYSEGVSSAHEVERRCEYHPAYRWLTGLGTISHRTMSGFRVEYQAALDDLFTQVLALLQNEGLIQLEQVTQDGTKVKAAASRSSLHRQATLARHLEEARARVQAMGDPQQDGGMELSRRQQAAQARAAREQVARMEAAMEEIKKVQAEAATDPKKDVAECRVSESEPEARKMKHADDAFAPSYNLQLETDATAGALVGMQVVQACNDKHQLEPGLQEVERRMGELPQQAVVDKGYGNRETVLKADEMGVDLYAGGNLEDGGNAAAAERNCKKRGVAPEFYPQQFVYDAASDLYRCPAGQPLPHRGVKQDRVGVERHQYRADPATCRACPHRAQCCPGKSTLGRRIVRTQNVPVVAAFVEKMKTGEAQAIYRQRGQTAEFPNLWIKDKLGLRRFRVRGLVKVRCEALWACLTYNLQLFARKLWKPRLAAAMATA
jgi:transposase